MMQNRSSSIQQNRDLWDRIWRNKKGDIVVWQRPNIPQIAWVVLTLASFFTTGTISNALWYLAAAALAIWAILEIALGVAVILLILAAYLKVGY
jgi:hypothetical protein